MRPEAVIGIKFACDGLSATLATIRYFIVRHRSKTLASRWCTILLFSAVAVDFGGSVGAAWFCVKAIKWRNQYPNNPNLVDSFVTSKQIMRALFWAHLCYYIALIIIKAAYLSFYTELYNRVQSKRRYMLYAGWLVWALASTIGILIMFLWCRPFMDNWNPLTTNPHCPAIITLNSFNAMAAVNIISDVAILGVPLVIISALRLGKTEKISLALVFGIGSISIVASVARLIVMDKKIEQKVITWDTVYIFAVISHAEAFFAMLAFTLPAFRYLVKKAIDKTVAAATKGSIPTAYGSGNGSHMTKHTSMELGYRGLDGYSQHATAKSKHVMRDPLTLAVSESEERIVDSRGELTNTLGIKVHTTFDITSEERRDHRDHC